MSLKVPKNLYQNAPKSIIIVSECIKMNQKCANIVPKCIKNILKCVKMFQKCIKMYPFGSCLSFYSLSVLFYRFRAFRLDPAAAAAARQRRPSQSTQSARATHCCVARILQFAISNAECVLADPE